MYVVSGISGSISLKPRDQLWHCRSAAIHPRYRKPASLGTTNTAANHNLPACSDVSAGGNGGMRKRAVLLKNLFLIRIGCRDPVSHILAKQRLVGAGNEPFAFSGFCTMAAATCFSVATVCFFYF
jgi:hypothetical protein